MKAKLLGKFSFLNDLLILIGFIMDLPTLFLLQGDRKAGDHESLLPALQAGSLPVTHPSGQPWVLYIETNLQPGYHDV